MFDNLREQADSTPFYEDEAQFRQAEGLAVPRRRTAGAGQFLGMTARQRFILSFMLLMAVCSLGAMCLLITGRISLSF